MQQHIPLGGGRSPHAVRRQRRPVRRWLPFGWPAVVAALGAGASLAGAALVLVEPSYQVGLDARGYRVAGQVLPDRGGGAYGGAGGGALVVERRAGRVLAAASADLDGRHTTGRCSLVPGGDREECTFTVNGRSLSAVDARTPGGWHRRYSDGRTVEIAVRGDRDTPVPFPLGR